mmetsp:Transcript_54260/g.126658  ORF Transcript_54260/g.126658 Transcript_54260/m.126658 type:complete len:246 (-) Transcript_54260:174-911(-)
MNGVCDGGDKAPAETPPLPSAPGIDQEGQPVSSAATETVRVLVRSLGGEELLNVDVPATSTVQSISAQVKPKSSGLWVTKLQLAGQVAEAHQCLGDLGHQDLEFTAIFVKESVAGVYAAWACSILVLHPDHRVAYMWYDDYWDDPLRESAPQRTAAQWASEETSGTWSMDGVDLEGEAVDRFLGDDVQFTAKVATTPDALSQGISEIILVSKLFHKFGEQERATNPEEKTFYKLCHFDGDVEQDA